MTSIATLTDQLTTGIGILTDLTLVNSVPLLDVLHALLIAYYYRSAVGDDSHRQIGWGQGFLATTIMCAGGGSTVAILRGEPLGILKSNAFWGIYGGAYWAMFSNPYIYQFFAYLFSMPLVEEGFTVVDAILRNQAIVQYGVDGVNSTLGSDTLWVAKLLCGTLAGAGGGFWIDTFNLTHHHWSFSTPQWLHEPTMDVKASFATSLFYVLAQNKTVCDLIGVPVMSSADAQTWGVVVLSAGLIYGVAGTRRQRKVAAASKKATKQKEQ